MTLPESDGARRFIWPADYYSSATPAPVLPQWAAFGCGAAAALFLIVVFAGGYLLSNGGFNEFFDLAIGMSVAEVKGQYAAEVSAEQKASIDREVDLMRNNLREGKVSIAALQPFLQTLRNVSSDKRVTRVEAGQLQSAAHEVNRHAAEAKPLRPLPSKPAH